ncbi:MAG: type II secretion system protein N [Gammaproteobacteria bacterium]|nr:type II secretion system protein N [Gammaproteobacteria bacterium]
MKSNKRLILVGVAAFLLFLIVQTPAHLIFGLVANNLPLKVYGVNGSVWNGEIEQINVGRESITGVQWSLHPSHLLMGRVAADISASLGQRRINAYAARSIGGDIVLKNVSGRIDAQTLLGLLKIPALQLGGEFNFNLQSVVLDGKIPLEAQGRVLWSDASSRFPQRLELGTLSAIVSTTDKGIQAELKDGGNGPLELNGDLTLTQKGDYDFNGVFASREGAQSMLGRSLNMMGRPNREGKVSVKNKGNLSALGF